MSLVNHLINFDVTVLYHPFLSTSNVISMLIALKSIQDFSSFMIHEDIESVNEILNQDLSESFSTVDEVVNYEYDENIMVIITGRDTFDKVLSKKNELMKIVFLTNVFYFDLCEDLYLFLDYKNRKCNFRMHLYKNRSKEYELNKYDDLFSLREKDEKLYKILETCIMVPGYHKVIGKNVDLFLDFGIKVNDERAENIHFYEIPEIEDYLKFLNTRYIIVNFYMFYNPSADEEELQRYEKLRGKLMEMEEIKNRMKRIRYSDDLNDLCIVEK